MIVHHVPIAADRKRIDTAIKTRCLNPTAAHRVRLPLRALDLAAVLPVARQLTTALRLARSREQRARGAH